ncbi:MAG: HEPN domain-containing protein [Bacillota bacterium]|nr:HEPN domain-containing protein [Bacillota bacterium]
MKQPDVPNVGNKKDVANYRLQIAKEDLDAAHVLLETESYRGANNRAYYAIFHAVSAVLALEGIAFKRHKDTLAYFNKNYVAAGLLPREIGRKIVKAEEIRHASDYDTFYIASKEDTIQQVATAEQLLQLLSDFCQDKHKNAE